MCVQGGAGQTGMCMVSGAELMQRYRSAGTHPDNSPCRADGLQGLQPDPTNIRPAATTAGPTWRQQARAQQAHNVRVSQLRQQCHLAPEALQVWQRNERQRRQLSAGALSACRGETEGPLRAKRYSFHERHAERQGS